MERNLLQLLLETVDRAIVALVVFVAATIHQVTVPVLLNSRELASVSLVEDGVFHTIGRLADGESEGAAHTDQAHGLLLDRLEPGRVATDLAVADADFAVLVRAPDHDPVVLVDDDDEGSTNNDSVDLDVVLELDLARALEFAEDARAPHIHDAVFGHGCRGVPRRNLVEAVGALRLAVLVVGHARVDSHWREHILIRIVADLTEVVSSERPQLAPGALVWVLEQDQRVVLAASHLQDLHALQRVLDLRRL